MKWFLLGTVVLAVGVTAGVTGWVLTADQSTSLVEALKAGGLAGASIVALYGLWLNDRRRRVEEQRQQVDSSRLDQERFLKSIELLGNDADQVRVGAMHALSGLAHNTPAYTQTVLDVLCAYLRRPFHHPRYDDERAPDLKDFAAPQPRLVDEDVVEADRERQVRIAAQQLITDLLPDRGTADQHYHLDLTGASLEFLNLSGKVVCRLLARRATFHGRSRLDNLEVHGWAMFTGSEFCGPADLRDSVFSGGLSLWKVRARENLDLTGISCTGFVDLKIIDDERVVLENCVVDPAQRIMLPEGWSLDGAQVIRSA
ncbi:hypothetical protein D5S17_22110 [Pseudonocardiaceae bacterium YIM PH 21723]|nr:hypothetical protein D5S17_22110 [Pseudonocardiaceae bacterium YIM PH 21723]